MKKARRTRPLLIAGAAALGVVFSLFLWLGPRFYETKQHGPFVRFSVSLVVLCRLDAVDFSSGENASLPGLAGVRWPIVNSPMGYDSTYSSQATGSVVRGEARADVPIASLAQVPAQERGAGIVRFSWGHVSIMTEDGPVPVLRLRQSPAPAMASASDIFQANLFAPAFSQGGVTAVPVFYGEETDEDGRPRRWAHPEDPPASGIIACVGDGRQKLLTRLARGVTIPSADTYFNGQAGKYRGYVSRYAEQYGLAASLVLAIMHTESNFNPFAVSRSRAVGLMQIVPDTAGHEAHLYLTGDSGAPTLETLFNPEHNIRYGAAYLHLLTRRYFGGVINKAARQMCIIAAYNGGPGAVLRLFNELDQDAAIARINALTPEQVYKALTTDMPNLETRRYVDLVLERMRLYAAG